MDSPVENPKQDPFEPSDPQDDCQQSEEFISLITRHQVTLFAFLLSIVPNPQDAEDVLQRANVVLWRKREQFTLGTNFKAWAFAVAKWEALGFLKTRKRESWLVYNEELTSLVAERLASLPDASLQTRPDALHSCLSQLSKSHRRLILERYQSGCSIKDCAERFGRSEAGLRVTLHRIRIALRQCIDRHHQSETA